MSSLLDTLQTLRPVNLQRLPRQFHSVAKQASFYIADGSRFQGFWKANWLPKFGFRVFFWRYFSSRLNIQCWQIFRGSEPEKNDFPLGKTMIFAKIVFSMKMRKLLDFAFVFGGQNEENPLENWIQKRVVFQHRIWRVFPSILSALGSPNIEKKSQIFDKIDVRKSPLRHHRFRIAFRMDFEPLGIRFCLIFESPEPVFLSPASHLERHVWSVSGWRICFDDYGDEGQVNWSIVWSIDRKRIYKLLDLEFKQIS